MAELFLLVQDDQKHAIWETRTRARIGDVNGAGIRQKHGGAVRMRSSVFV